MVRWCELHDHGLELTPNEIDLFIDRMSDVVLIDRHLGNWFH